MIELKHLKKIYHLGENEVRALDDVSLTINDGEFVAIMGPSGSGKSTLMNVIGLLDLPDEGDYILNGKRIGERSEDQIAELRRDTIGFIFQQFNLLPRLNAKENVELPLVYSKRLHERARAIELLEKVGMGKRTDHKPTELSGGQQQRVAIARSLINTPTLLLADEPTGNLDSASEREIMDLLKALNAQGITVVIVTHEDSIGEEANRCVRLRDGKIISDITKVPTAKLDAPKTNSYKTSSTIFAEIREHIQQGIRSVMANKVRSFLSMLGILIGVGAVVAMLAVGRGATESLKEQIASMGSNLLTVRSGMRRVGGVALEGGSVTRITNEDVEAVKKQVSDVVNTAPSVRSRAQVTYLNKNTNTEILGTTTNYESMKAATPIFGRFFFEDENQKRARVAVVGLTVVKNLFGNKNPIGKTIKINKINFNVIGVLPEKGAQGPRDQDDMIVIPINTVMNRLTGNKYIDSFDVEFRPGADSEAISESIINLLISRHRVPPSQQSDAFDVFNMAELQNMLSSTTQIMTLLLSCVAGISLLVGGIGIMNIMLVSVTERTREIGIRKAIGARRRDILMQFITEAFVISLCGGALGVALGYGASTAITHFAGWATSVSSESILMALGFSFAIGLFFGVYPALKAASLKPIEALRHE